MDAWVWDSVPSYRLKQSVVEDWLAQRFGYPPSDFEVEVRQLDTPVIAICET
jgi:hypothetical protein